MKILPNTALSFKRKLKPKEENDYSFVLNQAKDRLGANGKSSLIVPVTSLPQAKKNNTGVGNLASEDSIKFFKFAKQYWGINEIQLLPVGQYHSHKGIYPFYSGTSLDLGNHVINIKDYISQEEFEKIVKNNNYTDKVNFQNVIEKNSLHEKALQKLHHNIPQNLKNEFDLFKTTNSSWLEPKAIFSVLKEKYKTHNYRTWSELDANLFDEKVINLDKRKERIQEINSIYLKEIEFYKFKQFLAEKSLKNAKNTLNQLGLKLSGDLPCGYSYDEVWAHPNAFIKDASIGWGLPAPDYNSQEGINLLKKKVNLYAQRYDSIRVDASWTYVNPSIQFKKDGMVTKRNYGSNLLDIIDTEFKAVKGEKYNLADITHEFVASFEEFTVYDGNKLKQFLENRTKIYTSDWMDSKWGCNQGFLKRNWKPTTFIIGARNHDSPEIKVNASQVEVLSDILKIPENELKNPKHFLQAKLAEPSGAKNQMLFFMDGLGMKGAFLRNENKNLDYVTKIPENYFELYHSKVQNGEAYNPMDAMQKLFKAKGLDKKEPELYKKIVKFNKILKSKQTNNSLKIFGTIIGGIALVLCGFALRKTKKEGEQNVRLKTI